MINLIEQTIGEIVASDYRTAEVFRKYNIDFCCNGNRPLQLVCDQDGIDADKVRREIDETLNAPSANTEVSIDYRSWPLDLLADYIEKKHHRYVHQQIPVINAYLDKIARVHGDRHPELFEIKDLFEASAQELTAHMKKEEQILFPFIRTMVETKNAAGEMDAGPFGTVQNPIRMMMNEHDAEGARFRKIQELSNGYQPPADGCNTFKVTFATLREFEQDLHLHIHLENNILFPGATALEQSTCSKIATK